MAWAFPPTYLARPTRAQMLACRLLTLVACLGATVTSYEVQNAQVKMPGSLNLARGLSLHVYSPDAQNSSTKRFPVIWFATGFGCSVPVSIYSKMISAIVSKGYIVAGIYNLMLHLPKYTEYGQHMHNIMEWGKSDLAAAMADAKLNAVPDVIGRSAVMGQSAGNHIAGQALTDGCSVAKAFIMIDPVDGFDPFRIVKGEDLIKPGAKVKFTIPALLIDNGLDPVRSSRWFPPCAPATVSNDHFYNAWNGPIWNINATAYGHVDCLNDPSGLFCPSDTHMDKDLYRNMIGEAVTTFLGALFDETPNALSVLEDASHWKLDVVLKHDLKGKNYSQIMPGCSNAAPGSIVVV